MKFVPLIVRVRPLPPASAEVGLKLVMVGVPGSISKPKAADVLPSAFITATMAIPGLAIMAAVMAPWSTEELLKVVVTAVEFHRIFAPETNPAPFTVMEKAEPPEVALDGVRLETVADAIVKTTALEYRPFELNTWIWAAPGEASRLTGT